MNNHFYYLECVSSPDIFVASLDAFIKGYNELLYQLRDRPSSSLMGLRTAKKEEIL